MSARSFGTPTPQRGRESAHTPAQRSIASQSRLPAQSKPQARPQLEPQLSQIQQLDVQEEAQTTARSSSNVNANVFETPNRPSSGLFHSTLQKVWGNGGKMGSQGVPVETSKSSQAGNSDPRIGLRTTAKPATNGGSASARGPGSKDYFGTDSVSLSSAPTSSGDPMSGVSSIGPRGRNAGGHAYRAYEDDREAKSQETIYTTSNGIPVPHPYSVQRAGITGPLLLQDFHLIDLLSHFDRERIPERVVHAKGSGAHGVWECTDSLEDLCLADMFREGVSCPVTVRFSTVGGETGSPDTVRDPRGFSVKFKTTEGNWDFVANNTPVFFLRDPAKFPHFIHTQKRDPASHLSGGDDSTMFWDYLSQNPESIHQLMILMGDRGIPDGWRHMHGYFGHTLKLVNKGGDWVYAQFHLISDQGIKTLTAQEAATKSPDHGQKDLFEAIENGDYPSWTMKIQTMTQKQAEEVWMEKRINVFDLTHIWPHKEFPLRDVCKLTLNENVKNYFAEVEQAAFNPAHMVPGVEPSADPVLQSRLFSYPDAHRHRIGANYQQLPVNQPVCPFRMGNFQRDGQMAFFNQGSRPAYLSSIEPIRFKERSVNLNKVHGTFTGDAVSYLSEIRPEDFNAPRALWEKVFGDDSKQRFIETVSGHMSTCRRKEIIARQITIFRHVSKDLASRLEKATGVRGFETIEGMSFNGSHNGFGTKRPANGLRSAGEVVFNNGAPQPQRAR